MRVRRPELHEQHKRGPIEAGGGREVLMLVPSSIGLVNAAHLHKG
jgi:hypothetical protein